eukprot:scaffold134_cov111-Isochrysis_galbana.AAC.4
MGNPAQYPEIRTARFLWLQLRWGEVKKVKTDPLWSPIKDPGSKSLLFHGWNSLWPQRLSTYDVTNGKRIAWVPTASASGLRSMKV